MGETLRVHGITPDKVWCSQRSAGIEILDAVYLLKWLIEDLQCRGPVPTLVTVLTVPGVPVVSMVSMMSLSESVVH